MSIDVAIELIKLALGQITIFDLSEEAKASAKPTNYKNKEVNLYDGTTFYFPYDEAINVIMDTIEQPITTEEQLSEAYMQGKADGAKDFKEWLISKYGYAVVDIENDFDEWQKGTEND